MATAGLPIVKPTAEGPRAVSFPRHDTDFIDRYSSGGMKSTLSSHELKEERGVAWELVKQVGSSLLEGRELVSVSMPVKMFEPRSFLQRFADGWVYAPLYLNKATEIADPLERFKLVMAFALSTVHLQVTEKKPFNPILGETYQGRMEDGTEVFLEQTTHHPPASNWEVLGTNGWRYWGSGIFAASCTGNTVKATQKGPNYVDFPDGHRVSFSEPVIMIRGCMFGDRYVEFGGTMSFRDTQNKIGCDLHFNPDGLGFFKGLFSKAKSPSDIVRGEIVRYLGEMDAKDCPTESLGKVEGSWLGYMEVDGVRYWDIRDSPKSRLTPIDNPLPSDSRFRDDLQYLLKKDLPLAHEYKTLLEEAQRYDRKLRAKYAELQKKLAKKK